MPGKSEKKKKKKTSQEVHGITDMCGVAEPLNGPEVHLVLLDGGGMRRTEKHGRFLPGLRMGFRDVAPARRSHLDTATTNILYSQALGKNT
jgi:hypothetical protein